VHKVGHGAAMQQGGYKFGGVVIHKAMIVEKWGLQ
jgi:hypothetical protein